MTLKEIMFFLEAHGREQTRRIYSNQGIGDPKFGVKVADLKQIQKAVKKDYALSMALFDTGNYDAMYLAGLIADEKAMTKADLQHWMKTTKSRHIATTTVPWIAAESDHGYPLAKEWMTSEVAHIKAGGYATYSSLISLKDNEALNIGEIEGMLRDIVSVIHDEANDVRYEMNGFVIAAGGYIPALSEKAKACGDKIGPVAFKLGNSACKVPLIRPYIEKMAARGVKKRKQARC